MDARRTMVGAVGQIFLRPPAELGIGEHQAAMPPFELHERAFQGDDTIGEIGKQSRLRCVLRVVRIKARERNANDGNAGAIGDYL